MGIRGNPIMRVHPTFKTLINSEQNRIRQIEKRKASSAEITKKMAQRKGGFK